MSNTEADDAYDLADFHGLFYSDPDFDQIDRRVPSGDMTPNLDFLRLKDLAILLLNPRPGMRLLEMGCGRGANLVPCGLQGAEVAGQDLSAEDVAAANRHLDHFRIVGNAKVGNAVNLLFDDGRFDAVLSSDFHEHLTPDQQLAVLREACRVLAPGGMLVLKTPNLSYLRLALSYKRCRAVLRGRNPLSLVIPHTPGTVDPQHIGLTTRWRVTKQLIGAGFVNYRFVHAPLRRFGVSPVFEVLSTEIPVLRDWLSEDLILLAYKPIASAHFPPQPKRQATA